MCERTNSCVLSMSTGRLKNRCWSRHTPNRTEQPKGFVPEDFELSFHCQPRRGQWGEDEPWMRARVGARAASTRVVPVAIATDYHVHYYIRACMHTYIHTSIPMYIRRTCITYRGHMQQHTTHVRNMDSLHNTSQLCVTIIIMS